MVNKLHIIIILFFILFILSLCNSYNNYETLFIDAQQNNINNDSESSQFEKNPVDEPTN